MNNTYDINYKINSLNCSNMDYTSNSTDNAEDKESRLNYEKAVNSIKNFLKKFISKYSELHLILDESDLTASFRIKVPKNMSVNDLVKFSEEILKKVSEFVDSENINFILPDLNIALTK